MARAPERVEITPRPSNTPIAILLVVASLMLGFATGMAFGRTQKVCPPAEKHTQAQDVQLYIISLGVLRWERACAHALGKDGVTFDKVDNACTVKELR